MIKCVLTGLCILTLAACGVDGEPMKPAYTAKQTVGYNSKTGSFTKSVVGICFGDNADCS